MIMKMIKMMLLTMMILTMSMKKMKKMNIKNKMMNPIECGFNNMKNKKKAMKMKFLSVMMIFIIFDLEMSIITPTMMTMKKNILMNIKMMTMILTFMMLSMMYEMKIKTIKWN
uniref:NADH dehydrogenase subunit 3 n=1 Tax=Parasaissetia nigra TaxID=1069709 RepID=UPI00220C3AC8|nr:NADH dehydrogenase subunit 3 [Parasaissetia nigra]UXW93665.1 NADH dehydrogenase subunit 3 [Parasaissetia nigra]